MKRIQVNENRCLGCHLCEYYCVYANSKKSYMPDAFKDGEEFLPRVHVESDDAKKVSYAVSCRHCSDPICVKGCITGALHVVDGVIEVDEYKCVSCRTCVLLCPYGAIVTSKSGAPVKKCELCLDNCETPSCAKHCPNGAIVTVEVKD